MKKAVVISMLVLVGCLCYQANGATSTGKTTDCNAKAEEWKNFCHRLSCDNESGHYDIATCGVSAVECPEGQVAEKGKEDLTRPYPDCCPRPYCRDA